MKLTVQDLAMFLGCEVRTGEKTIGTLSLYNIQGVANNRWDPILRPISDITDEEKKEIYHLIFNRPFPDSGRILFFPEKTTNAHPRWVLMSGIDRLGIELNGTIWADCDLSHMKHNQHMVTKLMISKHFDVFGWIEKGLAISKV